jgi:hypothetical protein
MYLGQDVEFTRYDKYAIFYYIVFVSLSYVGHEVDRNFSSTNSHQGACVLSQVR